MKWVQEKGRGHKSLARRFGAACRWPVRALLLLPALVLVPSAEAARTIPVGAHAAEVQVQRIDSFCRDPAASGRLQFRGGLVLKSSDADFGGISGLSVDATVSRFLAISDKAEWIEGRFVYDGNGRFAGITDTQMAPMLDVKGRPLRRREYGSDTESLAVGGGAAYVGIEGSQQVRRYDLDEKGFLARGVVVPLPPGVGDLPSNRGLEALAIAPPGPLAGTLVAIAEEAPLDADTTAGFLVGGQTPGAFRVKRHDNFDVTDAAFLPNGDLLLLERYYSGFIDLKMRLRRIPGDSIAPGKTLDGEILMTAGLECEIDNMEGLAVHRGPSGETLITLMSDDNFSMLQRTIVLRFALP